MEYIKLDQKLEIYRQIDDILNEGGDQETFDILLNTLTEAEVFCAKEYWARNTPSKWEMLEELAKTPFVSYTTNSPRTDEEWAQEYQELIEEEQEEVLPRYVFLFHDHDSDEYQEMLEMIWDREDTKVV